MKANAKGKHSPQEEGETFFAAMSYNVFLIACALCFAFFVRIFFFQPFTIPSRSMMPTLLVGDYLFTTKYTYGYSKYSFPFSLVGFEGRFFERVPHIGDVLVFRATDEENTDYIKRVIALPGDKVEMKTGRLYLNDVPVKETPLPNETVDANASGNVEVRVFEEELPGGVNHKIYKITRDGAGVLDNVSAVIVPEGHFFVMGDNRDNSEDSRAFGVVPFENIIGKARFTFVSQAKAGAWWRVWNWKEDIRWNRTLKPIV